METAIDQPDARTCPVCGSPLPSDAPQGLCPKCLLAGATAATEPSTGAPQHYPPQAPPLDQVAAAFPQFEILELIGTGGMGAVFKARQLHLDRLVALKVLPLSLAANPTFAERFNREARVLARLNHPNIVTVHDFGRAGDFFFLLMEYVDGVNLRQAMQAGRFSPEEALRIVPSICEALQFAHEEGILHRDIKPENILLDARGRVKIADFGIAKLIGEVKPDVTLTGTGAAIGTPQYMAPEQLERPAEVDHRADIYSLGVVFYEMLTGELPMGRFAPPSAKTPVGARVDEVVLRTLEKERDRRYQTAAEMKTEVENATHAGHAPPRPQSSAPPIGPSGRVGPVSPSPRSAATPWILLILGIAGLMVMGTIVLGAIGLFAVLALGGGRSNIAISPLLGVAVLLCFAVLILVLSGIAVLFFARRRQRLHAHGEKGPLGNALSAANLGALSTGASVVLFLPVLLFAWHSVEPLSHGASLSLTAFIGVACLTLLSLGLGILGMISGWHALRTLRSNPGQGPGRRRAVFGAAGWPLLLLTTVPTGACWLFLSQTNRGLARLALLEVAVVGPVLAAGLIWAAWRWSQGLTCGQRPNRGSLANLLGALAVVLLLPIVLFFFFPAATTPRAVEAQPGLPAEPPAAPVVKPDAAADPDPRGAFFDPREPGIRLYFTVPSGLAATFALVRSNHSGLTPFPGLSAYAVAGEVDVFAGRARWGVLGHQRPSESRRRWGVSIEKELAGPGRQEGGDIGEWDLKFTNRMIALGRLDVGDRTVKIGERNAGTDDEEGLYIHLSVRTLDFPGAGTTGKLGTAYGTGTTNWIERLHGPRD